MVAACDVAGFFSFFLFETETLERGKDSSEQGLVVVYCFIDFNLPTGAIPLSFLSPFLFLSLSPGLRSVAFRKPIDRTKSEFIPQSCKNVI